MFNKNIDLLLREREEHARSGVGGRRRCRGTRSVGRGSGLVDRSRSVGRWVCRWSASVSGVGRGLFGRSVVSVGVEVGSVGGRRRVSRSQARSNSTALSVS